MDIFGFLTMIGGLAFFLFGMNTMGDGLSKVSGGRLEKILEKLTGNPIRAVLVGCGVTAVIQSSSATTVMVVGFVNSGIMKLSQAVGIIMGANIGTTVTSWILSLSGIESDNFLVRFLKPTSFSPILAVIGIAFIMFSKKEKKRDCGLILIGFAVLMTGMDIMSGAVKPLANVPEFTNILIMFSNPVLGLLAGAVLTAIIQSSSASVGILQALCVTGSVSYGAAIPIIMGQNIGTCVTAMLSAIGASKNAKRTALVHLYFNIIGTVLFMVIFYSINMFVDFNFLKDSANASGIAVIHSLFNVAATLVLLPFSKAIEKLACLTVKDSSEDIQISETEKELQLLDARFIETPGLAMEHCRKVCITMARLAQKAMFEATELLKQYDENKVQEVVRLEEEVDRFEDCLGNYMVKVSSRDLSEKDSQSLNVLLHCIGDFERISDHAVNLVSAIGEMHEKEVSFSKKATEELRVYTNAIRDILDTTIDAFANEDKSLAILVEPLEEVVDELNIEVKRRHVKRLRKGKCTIELGFILSDITNNYERVSDHCSNIAINVIQGDEEIYDPHEYLWTLRSENNMDFKGKVLAYREKYMLPE